MSVVRKGAAPRPPVAPPPPVAVTGPGGWIGRRLSEIAAARALPLRPIDRETLDSDGALRERLANCRALIHLAAIAHRPHGAVDDEQFDVANHRLALRVARAARDAGVPRVVLVSTAKVMGERSGRPFNECDPPAPADAYARSKLAAERALLALHEPGRFDVVVARPPLVYGPGARANFAALVRAAARRWPLPLADATALRSLVHLDNLVDALLFLSDCPAAAGHVYFVADGTDVSVAGIVGRFRRLQGRRAGLFPFPPAVRAFACAAARLAGADLAPVFERVFAPLQVDAAALRALGWAPPLAPQRALDATLESMRAGLARPAG